MCEHEGKPCSGKSCRCECMNCMFPEDNPMTEAKADLKTLVEAIPEELQSEDTYYAANRLYDFIDAQSELYE